MIVNSVETLQKKMAQVRAAQAEFAKFTQEQVDEIFFQVSMAANQARIPLAKMAVEETGIGVAEDKVIKNHYASEYIYNAYKDLKTWGKEELRVTKALCQKKIPQRNIWSEAIPVVAIIISCGSVFISILGIVFGTLSENQIMQEMAESEIRFDEYAVIFILIIGLATILWFISTIQYIVGNKYKSLLYMCESILEAKENTMIE